MIEHEVQVNDGDDNFISHTMYIIPAREGVGGSPSIADEVYVTYKGMFLVKSRMCFRLALLGDRKESLRE